MLFLIVCAVMAMFLAGYSGYQRGTAPLTKLKPGREYKVESVLWSGNGTAMLVVSWHVDYGHYEYRVARLSLNRFRVRGPLPGDIIEVRKERKRLDYVILSAGV
jgi:hypothetical protein